jgi:hypothetical protein
LICRFGCKDPIARFKTPNGCVCFPEDKEQDLCAQHIIKDGFIGEFKLLKVYNAEICKEMGIL